MEGACLADTMDAAEGGDALHVLIMLRARAKQGRQNRDEERLTVPYKYELADRTG